MKPLRIIIKLLLISGIIFGFGYFLTVYTSGIDDYPSPEYPIVIWTENPSENAVILWTTLSNNESNMILYDTVSHGGDESKYTFNVPSVRNVKILMQCMLNKGEVTGGYYQHAKLSELRSSTSYYFVIKNDNVVSDEYHFTSAP